MGDQFARIKHTDLPGGILGLRPITLPPFRSSTGISHACPGRTLGAS
eukprot:gene26742-biopygen17276